MPRVSNIQTNFTAGALSPKVQARVDIARYNNGAKRLTNVTPLIYGGARRRPGTRFVKATKTAATRARVIPFVVNRDSAYVLEFGDLYVRFFKDGAALGAPLELASPYTAAQLFDIDYAQDAGTMYLFHPSHPIYRLRRFSDTQWDLSAAPFTTTPFKENGRRPAVTLTLSAATVGAGRTFTASGAAFEVSDVGRAISYQGGLALITGYTDTLNVTCTITIAFTSVNVPAGWLMDISPQTALTPGAAGPVGTSISMTLAAAGWRSAEDIGKFVQINGGLVKLTGYTSTTIMAGTVIRELTSATAAPALAWSLEGAVWNATDGYPRTGTLHDQRLIAAGSTGYPQTIWGSLTGEPLDFTLGELDGDAFAFTLASDETNPIAFVSSARNLLVLTYGGEYSLRGGVEKPITPTNVQIKPESNHGCAAVRPVTIGREVMFAQRANRRVRAMGYRYDFDGYTSPDISALGEHLLTAGIVDMAFQQEPDPLLWVALANGLFVCCTLDRDQEVVAWADQWNSGEVESMCTIPTATAEQLWLIVRRTINGVSVRYLERIDIERDPSELDVRCTDCSMFLFGAGTVFSGLTHLANTLVDIKADGVAMPQQTVSAIGEITLPREANSVEVGIPYQPTIELLTPEVGTPTGTAQGNAMSISEVTLNVLDSIGCLMNGQTIAFRQFGPAILDEPPQPFTGLKRIEGLGWERGDAPLVVTQVEPYPLHLRAVIRKVTVNDG